jgi:hypothetical protein
VSFPTKTVKRVSENNEWITKGIKTSCKHKQYLYLNCQSSNNQLKKIHYRKYFKILTQVIKEAKRMHYNKEVLESNNKVKAVWKIVKKETEEYSTEELTPSIKVNDNAIKNPKLLANSFNTYFLTQTQKTAIFICLVTKAVHLELMSNLTTDALKAALRRFTAR